MKTHIGNVVSGDLEDNIMSIRIDSDMELQAGKVAVVPLVRYRKLKTAETLASKRCNISTYLISLTNTDNGKCIERFIAIGDDEKKAVIDMINGLCGGNYAVKSECISCGL